MALQIEGITLGLEHVGSKVTFIPHYAHGNAGHPDCEGGTIASFNDTFVFVDYGKGNRPGTSPEDLVWG